MIKIEERMIKEVLANQVISPLQKEQTMDQTRTLNRAVTSKTRLDHIRYIQPVKEKGWIVLRDYYNYLKGS